MVVEVTNVNNSEIPPRLNICVEVLDDRLAMGFGPREAFVWDGGAITYQELYDRVVAFTEGLGRIGVRLGDPVLFRLPNCLEFLISFLSVVRLGALPVLQNSLLRSEEVEYVIGHSDAMVAITMADIAGPLRDLCGHLDLNLVVARGASEDEYCFEDLVDTPVETGGALADTSSDDPAFLVYTSGTTGRPKGIVHAHRWVRALGGANAWRVPPEPGDVVLATGEWSFISALGHNVLFPLWNGTKGVILEGRAHPERVLEVVEQHGVTLLYSVATVYRRMLAIEGIEMRYDVSSLRGCNATGEALEEATWREFKIRFGCDIWEHYGISEKQLVLGQGPRYAVRPGSIGQPIPGTRIVVMDAKYSELADGEIGNILIEFDNPGFFVGYHKDPAKTDEVVHDGWYHTGDLAWRDADGFYWIAGRSDDCFKSRGIFISPYEIENALRVHSSVAEACVVPLPDAEIGNRIRAVVVTRDGQAGDDALAGMIRVSLGDRIAPYKVPHVVEFVDELPKSPVGKVLRRALTD